MKRHFLEILRGFGSLLTGMRITLQQFFKPPVTVHYPHESLKMAKRYRGHIVLVRDQETGESLCVACKSCEKACPSDCIIVNGIKREGDKKKSVTEFKLNFTTCSLCGSCVEVCPTDALAFSKEYNLASTSKEAFYQRSEAEAK
jgi:NADH-quinone oxidoreductase subunit I